MDSEPSMTAPRPEGPAGLPVQPMRLDAFSYFPDVASRIQGLGGPVSRPELSYGFHTHYVAAQPGRCTFSITLEELSATYGILYLQVNAVAAAPGSKANLVIVERVPFAELVAMDGVASVRFQAIAGHSYALYGKIIEDTDARATGLTVTLDRPRDEALDASATSLAIASHVESFQFAESLASPDRPKFAFPVSQAFTSEQLREEDFVRWRTIFGASGGDPISDWPDAFILQSLAVYGPVAPARILGRVDAPRSRTPAVLAAEGHHIAMFGEPCDMESNAPLARFSNPQIVADEILERSIAFVEGANGGDLYDALWTYNVIGSDRLGEVWRPFAVDLMQSLKIGGVAVHVFEMVESWEAPDAEASAGRRALTCTEIERLALTLVSHGDTVAQVRFGLGRRGTGQRRPFGMIARRGR